MSKIIRTTTRAEGGITAEEKVQMDALTELWTRRAFRTEPIEPEKITEAIKRLYKAAGLECKRVVIVPSPLAMAMAYGFSSAIWYARKSNWQATDQATDQATLQATDQATFQATFQATDQATDQATRRATFQATFQATDQATEKTDWFNLALEIANGKIELAKLMTQCAPSWHSAYQGGNMWAGWVAYLSAGRDILGLQLNEHENFKAYEDCAIHGGFRALHEEFCIVSDFPEYIKTDDQNRPHCETGASHRWRDGWELFHWHGVAIPGEWVTGKKPTASEALHWENMEQRRAACEIVGWANILRELDSKVIDADDDPEIGTLLQCEIPDSGKERFLQVRCGTGRDFVMHVPKDCNTALEAQAWMFQLDVKSFIKPEVRT